VSTTSKKGKEIPRNRVGRDHVCTGAFHAISCGCDTISDFRTIFVL